VAILPQVPAAQPSAQSSRRCLRSLGNWARRRGREGALGYSLNGPACRSYAQSITIGDCRRCSQSCRRRTRPWCHPHCVGRVTRPQKKPPWLAGRSAVHRRPMKSLQAEQPTADSEPSPVRQPRHSLANERLRSTCCSRIQQCHLTPMQPKLPGDDPSAESSPIPRQPRPKPCPVLCRGSCRKQPP
jgi:hypothetical protein